MTCLLRCRRLLIGLLIILCLLGSRAGAQESKFLRFVDDDRGGGELQASIVRYRNAEGATVDLIAAVHVADRAFYHRLNRQFDQYDALLYEMVKPAGAPAPRPGQRSGHWVGGLQQVMKLVLELDYQLDGIDYQKPHFVHADLDVDTFLRMQADRGESFAQLILRSMLHEMRRQRTGGGGTSTASQPDLAEFLAALQTPDRGRQLKLMFARQFSQMDQMVAGMEGPRGSVILTERNKAAVRVLQEQLAKGKKRLGLFYGAAHLAGIEQMILDLGFEQVGEPEWLTAWDMRTPGR